jgi:ABC-type multidrug transport system fused ATPase/permease subunit
MLVYLSPSLALLSLAVIPPVGIVGVFYGRYTKRKQKAVQAALGKTMEVRCRAGETSTALLVTAAPRSLCATCVVRWLSQTAEELVSNIRTVRSFAQELREKTRFNERIEEAYEESKKVCRVLAMLRFLCTVHIRLAH